MNRIGIAVVVLSVFLLVGLAGVGFCAEKKKVKKEPAKEAKAQKVEVKAEPTVAKSKALVVFYSRTGNTKKVAEEIAAVLKCDIEEIIDTKDRSGVSGYLASGKDAMKKKLTVIKEIKNDPAQYDLILLGTPVWAGKMSTPVRTYIVQNKEKIKNAAFFCTMGGSGDAKTFVDMEEATGKKPAATMTVLAGEIKKGEYKAKVDEFVKALAGIKP